jgi:hypothetical protein
MRVEVEIDCSVRDVYICTTYLYRHMCMHACVIGVLAMT